MAGHDKPKTGLQRKTPLSRSPIKRKTTRKSPPEGMPAKAEKVHLDAVAKMPCAVCGCFGVHVHHIRTGIGAGMRATSMQTIPLCFEHHQGETGIHGLGRKAFERAIGKTELQLLAETLEKING